MVTLFTKLDSAGLSPRRQTVSIGLVVNARGTTYDLDLVPAKKRDDTSGDHSLYHRKSGTVRKTNIERHISAVRTSGRLDEIRVLKIWRNKNHLEFPSFYLELTVIAALSGRPVGDLSNNVSRVFTYLRDVFPNAAVYDPAVPSNAVSDDLTQAERLLVKNAASRALSQTWSQVFS